MKHVRKQYYLKNIASSSIIRKIEFDLSRVFKNGTAKINPATNILLIEFRRYDSIEKDIEQIIAAIKKVDDNIVVEEKEITPTYRKVLLLEHLDCANCAAKLKGFQKNV